MATKRPAELTVFDYHPFSQLFFEFDSTIYGNTVRWFGSSTRGRKEHHDMSQQWISEAFVMSSLFDFHWFLRPSKIEHGSTVTRVHGVSHLCSLTRQSTNYVHLKTLSRRIYATQVVDWTHNKNVACWWRLQRKDQSQQASNMDFYWDLKLKDTHIMDPSKLDQYCLKFTAPLSSSKMHGMRPVSSALYSPRGLFEDPRDTRPRRISQV